MMSTVTDKINSKIPLVVVLGPTASGKTATAISIAKEFDGEIVSADSMQIYKEMDIGTAKPNEAERLAAVHHLVDFADLGFSCSAAEYSKLAHGVIEDIHKRGRLAVLAGGTGLYINAVASDMSFSDEHGTNEELRKSLLELMINEGVSALYDILCELDPTEAQIIDKNNPSRLIRAVEVCKTTGMTMTEYKKRNLSENSRYNVLKIGVSYNDRQLLYDRINHRVDLMLEEGLLEEARAVLQRESKTASQAIGYKEFIPYFNNTETLESCVEKVKQESRRYAKRQLTWFRRDKAINWFFRDEYESLEEYEKKIKLVVDKFLNM